VITTVNVAIKWAKPMPGLRDGGPVLREDPTETLSIRDPRVLLGVQQALAQRAGVTQAPDLVSASGTPYFAVSVDNHPPSASMFDSGQTTGALLLGLTEPVRFSVVYAADGGWKTVLVDIVVEVI
jgi:hypothetical protein